MPVTAVIGAQWGDEGKGKIIDILTENADAVIRYQGGHNAGHTIVVGDEKFVCHLVPSGILHPDRTCIIGNGLVVDPGALVAEIGELRDRGVAIGKNLSVSGKAHCIMPYHRLLDQAAEERKGARKIGTTARGIGPAYADKAARSGIRLHDLLDEARLSELIREQLEEKNVLLRHLYGKALLDHAAVCAEVFPLARQLAPFVRDTGPIIDDLLSRNARILLEGAQGTMLDVDHGTYPFVTSSSSTAGGACTGTGIGPRAIDRVVGVIKAYTTRVGEGPFPTELNDALGEKIRARGNEYGASTGRPRRCGWFDAVVARYSARVNSLDGLALTKVDVLDGIDPIRVCVGYEYKGKRFEDIPADINVLTEGKPLYRDFPGWLSETVGVTEFDRLPAKARDYISHLEEMSGVPFDIISTGVRRQEAILGRRA
jgi:adenylosuccinate synthase